MGNHWCLFPDGRTQNVEKVFLKNATKKLQTCLERSTSMIFVVISHQVRWIGNRHWWRRLKDCFLNMTSCSCSTKSWSLGAFRYYGNPIVHGDWTSWTWSFCGDQIVVTNGEVHVLGVILWHWTCNILWLEYNTIVSIFGPPNHQALVRRHVQAPPTHLQLAVIMYNSLYTPMYIHIYQCLGWTAFWCEATSHDNLQPFA